jgi:hypothetical protein
VPPACRCIASPASLKAVLQDTLCHRACATPRWFNFLVRNKWESKRDIQHLARLPVLLLSSLKVSTATLFTFITFHKGCRHAQQQVQLPSEASTGIVRISSRYTPLQDEMLPPEHMLQLYNVLKAAGSKRLVWTEFPTGNHMETYELCRQEYWPAVRAFFQQNIASGAAHTVTLSMAPCLPYSRRVVDNVTSSNVLFACGVTDDGLQGKAVQPGIEAAAPDAKVAAPGGVAGL